MEIERHFRPYDFVSLTGKCQPESVRDGHARAENLSGNIEAVYEVLTYLHIGTGITEASTGKLPPLYQPTFRVNGKPRIPGSSLKGAVRTVVEAITPSCVLQTKARTTAGRRTSCSDPSKLCPACRMFGAMGFLGRVSFSDGRPISGGTTMVSLPQMWRPRPEEAQRYYQADGQPRGYKFYLHGQVDRGSVPVEVWHTGSKFSVGVQFVDLTERELGLLCVAMGVSPDEAPGLTLKFGGHKPSCCGSARLSTDGETRVIARDPVERWREGRLGPETSSRGIVEFARRADLCTGAYERLRDVLEYSANSQKRGGYQPEDNSSRRRRQ